MPWFLVGDQMHSASLIRKIAAIEPAAVGLWTVAGSWSSGLGTNGLIPDDDLPWLFPDAPRLAQVLVTAGAWKRVRNGHMFVPDDVTHRIPTREAVDKGREAAAERQRRSRERKSSRRDSRVTGTVTAGVTPGPNPDPSQSILDSINHLAAGKALADEDLILKTIIDLIHERTGCALGADRARSIATSILGGRNLSDPVAYVHKAITAEPNPRQRFLTEPCGQCNPYRRLEGADGRDAGPCPRCVPASQNGARS